MPICYITAFLDINRSSWKTFKRTPEDYIKAFYPFIKLFEEAENETMILFLDSRHRNKLPLVMKNIIVIDLDETYLNKLYAWRCLERERAIMSSLGYKKLISHRTQYPENTIPEYTIINHCKIDFIGQAMKIVEFPYYCWVDFGFFSKPENIPKRLLDPFKLDTSRVNYCVISTPKDTDNNILYTLQNAPETFTGYFFFGPKEALIQYQKLYHKNLDQFQAMNIADDDQHIALRCYFENPSLFRLHTIFWHKPLLVFQKDT
jgi:hypothetical protein